MSEQVSTACFVILPGNRSHHSYLAKISPVKVLNISYFSLPLRNAVKTNMQCQRLLTTRHKPTLSSSLAIKQWSDEEWAPKPENNKRLVENLEVQQTKHSDKVRGSLKPCIQDSKHSGCGIRDCQPYSLCHWHPHKETSSISKKWPKALFFS